MALDPLAPRSAGRTWFDDGRLDEDWTWPRRSMSLSRRLSIGVPLVVLVVALLLVWGFGGFRARTDQITRVPLGAEVTTGPLVFTFASAVVTAPGEYDSEEVWTISVRGTVRNTGTKTEFISAGGFATVLLGAPGATGLTELYRYRAGYRLGDTYESGMVNPGLPAVPVVLQFRLPLDWPPSSLVRVVVQHQVYDDVSLLGTGREQGWRRVSTGTEVLVPTVVV